MLSTLFWKYWCALTKEKKKVFVPYTQHSSQNRANYTTSNSSNCLSCTGLHRVWLLGMGWRRQFMPCRRLIAHLYTVPNIWERNSCSRAHQVTKGLYGCSYTGTDTPDSISLFCISSTALGRPPILSLQIDSVLKKIFWELSRQLICSKAG